MYAGNVRCPAQSNAALFLQIMYPERAPAFQALSTIHYSCSMRREQIKSLSRIPVPNARQFAADGEGMGEGLQPEDTKRWYRTLRAATTLGRQGRLSGAWLSCISVNHCITDSVFKYDLCLYLSQKNNRHCSH